MNGPPGPRARDRAGRFNPTLQRLLDADLVTASRISGDADRDPADVRAGDTLHVRWVHPWREHNRGVPDLYVVGCLWWGDHTGDDVARSNHRSLQRNFPNQFVHLHDGHGAQGLALSPGCRDTALAEALLRLLDYPLYDEDDHSRLIAELAADMWDAYVRLDLAAVLRNQHHLDTDDLGVDDRTLRDMFYRIHGECFTDEYAPTATSIVFPSLHAIAARMAAELPAAGTG